MPKNYRANSQNHRSHFKHRKRYAYSNLRNRLTELEHEKYALQEKMEKSNHKLPSSEASFRTTLNFLANPYELWRSEKLADRRTALKLVMPTPMKYCKKEGFRTTPTPCPIWLLGESGVVKEEMVPDQRLKSNFIQAILAGENAKNQPSSNPFSELLTPESCTELFDTLADWNKILENPPPHLPKLEF